MTTLRQIADRQGIDIATVASAAILERQGVAAVTVGVRNRSHLISNVAISGLALTAQDHDLIAGVLAETRPLEGDVYGLERDHWSGNRALNS
ncbi:aryl-alcohol dehydrogenase-like predicted oxidoreductase (plasmid) [Ensifer sp. WSM1721]|uniref:aldo/keto reductase n=1 Tax=Ensifer sp. WSM1721 TaxID=1041159 RepID=UPI00047D2759